MCRVNGGEELSETNQAAVYSFLDGRIEHIAGPPDDFTGVIGRHINGNRHFKYPINNGKFHGLCRVWHENGNLAVEENYEYGKHIRWRKS